MESITIMPGKKSLMNEVMSAIKFFKEVKGASAKQIIDYVLDQVNMNTKRGVTKKIKETIIDGIRNGVLLEDEGLFSINKLNNHSQIEYPSVSEIRRRRRRGGRRRRGRSKGGKSRRRKRTRMELPFSDFRRRRRRGGKKGKGRRGRGRRRHTKRVSDDGDESANKQFEMENGQDNVMTNELKLGSQNDRKEDTVGEFVKDNNI